MRWKDRQKRVEEKVYDAIEEIADEFDLEVPFYPEVYYVGRSFDFSSVGIDSFGLELTSSEDDDKEEEAERVHGLVSSGVCLIKPSVVLIKDLDNFTIPEESSHFLHLSRSRLVREKYEKNDQLCLRIFVETLGYLGSKMICPERVNTFNIGPDLYWLSEEEFGRYFDLLSRKCNSPIAATEHYIYQQARGLGERLFQKYTSGKLGSRYVKNLFEESFDLSPSHIVANLKLDHWRKRDKLLFDSHLDRLL